MTAAEGQPNARKFPEVPLESFRAAGPENGLAPRQRTCVDSSRSDPATGLAQCRESAASRVAKLKTPTLTQRLEAAAGIRAQLPSISHAQQSHFECSRTQGYNGADP